MKLGFKLAGILISVIVFLVIIDGYLSVQREFEHFNETMHQDAILLGDVLRVVLPELWKNEGEDSVIQLIDRLNKAEHKIKISWVWLDETGGKSHRTTIPMNKLGPVKQGHVFSLKNKELGFLFTYIPISVPSPRPGAVELAESLRISSDYLYGTVLRIIILSLLLIFIGILVVIFISNLFIVKPVKQLVGKTKAISLGDLSSDVELRSKDELTQVASALNSMCHQLELAQEKIAKETGEKIVALEQLRHSERLATVGRLSSGIAHELGTPLNVVMGRAKSIATEKLNHDEIVTYSTIIREQTERMINIIKQLLVFARRGKTKKTLTQMAYVIQQVIEILTPIARKARVTLSNKTSQDLPSITVDQSQIQQVLINVIMNGIQSMSDGGQLTVETNVKSGAPPDRVEGQSSNFLAISIRDQGSGIDDENLDHVFEPFFTTKDIGEGTGLGLSIAHGIIADHGGWIEVSSEKHVGSCFKIFLPVQNI